METTRNYFEYEVDKQIRLAREKEIEESRTIREAKKKREADYKEENRLLKKANKLHKTIEQVKKEEAKKAEERKAKAKYNRYIKDIEELKRILNYKKNWIETYEKKNNIN